MIAYNTSNYVSNSTSAGFEPARAKPNGFQVRLLNHSDTMSLGSSEIRTRVAAFKVLCHNQLDQTAITSCEN